MPYPKQGDTEKEYIVRFMSSTEAAKDYPDEKQRYAVAHSLWSKRRNSKGEHISMITNREKFINSFMNSDSAKAQYKDLDQRKAVAVGAWEHCNDSPKLSPRMDGRKNDAKIMAGIVETYKGYDIIRSADGNYSAPGTIGIYSTLQDIKAMIDNTPKTNKNDAQDDFDKAEIFLNKGWFTQNYKNKEIAVNALLESGIDVNRFEAGTIWETVNLDMSGKKNSSDSDILYKGQYITNIDKNTAARKNAEGDPLIENYKGFKILGCTEGSRTIYYAEDSSGENVTGGCFTLSECRSAVDELGRTNKNSLPQQTQDVYNKYQQYIVQGKSMEEAIKATAKDFGISEDEMYTIRHAGYMNKKNSIVEPVTNITSSELEQLQHAHEQYLSGKDEVALSAYETVIRQVAANYGMNPQDFWSKLAPEELKFNVELKNENTVSDFKVGDSVTIKWHNGEREPGKVIRVETDYRDGYIVVEYGKGSNKGSDVFQARNLILNSNIELKNSDEKCDKCGKDILPGDSGKCRYCWPKDKKNANHVIKYKGDILDLVPQQRVDLIPKQYYNDEGGYIYIQDDKPRETTFKIKDGKPEFVSFGPIENKNSTLSLGDPITLTDGPHKGSSGVVYEKDYGIPGFKVKLDSGEIIQTSEDNITLKNAPIIKDTNAVHNYDSKLKVDNYRSIDIFSNGAEFYMQKNPAVYKDIDGARAAIDEYVKMGTFKNNARDMQAAFVFIWDAAKAQNKTKQELVTSALSKFPKFTTKEKQELSEIAQYAIDTYKESKKNSVHDFTGTSDERLKGFYEDIKKQAALPGVPSTIYTEVIAAAETEAKKRGITLKNATSDHKLVIDSLRDTQAHCSGCSWTLTATSSDSESDDKIRDNIKSHFDLHLRSIARRNSTDQSPEELAESFINGNISYVRQQIGGDISTFNKVLKILEDGGHNTESFRRLMSLKNAVLSDFKVGQKVKNRFGETLTVLLIKNGQIICKEEPNTPYHPDKLYPVDDIKNANDQDGDTIKVGDTVLVVGDSQPHKIIGIDGDILKFNDTEDAHCSNVKVIDSKKNASFTRGDKVRIKSMNRFGEFSAVDTTDPEYASVHIDGLVDDKIKLSDLEPVDSKKNSITPKITVLNSIKAAAADLFSPRKSNYSSKAAVDKTFFGFGTKKNATMNTFKITYEDGNTITTGFNGTLEDAKKYYEGRVFNVGADEHDKMVKAIKVEQL